MKQYVNVIYSGCPLDLLYLPVVEDVACQSQVCEIKHFPMEVIGKGQRGRGHYLGYLVSNSVHPAFWLQLSNLSSVVVLVIFLSIDI